MSVIPGANMIVTSAVVEVSNQFQGVRVIFLFFAVKTLMFFFFSFIFIHWRLITLQYCSGFCHTLTWISHGFTCVPHPNLPLPPPSPSHPSGSSQCTNPEHPSHASNLGWWSVSPLIVGEGEGGMFRENSIETSIYHFKLVFPLNTYPGRGLLYHMATLFLVFRGTSILFSIGESIILNTK